MSMALMGEMAQLKARLDAQAAQIESVRAENAALAAAVKEYAAERRDNRKELRELREQFATFHALREAIQKDAREILGAVRDRIDPTKVKMPRPLVALGYSVQA